jgi:glycosyltransferase involved in cell wall biosynthesis
MSGSGEEPAKATISASGRPRRPLVTVVCPVFNEERTVPLFYERFAKAIAEISTKVDFQLLFVNNRSKDGTLDVVRSLAAKDPRIAYITLSRNYGYQASITAGMRHAQGDAIINIDVDCEDPPEMLPGFIERWLSGTDVVYGIRDKRPEFFLMHLARKVFYRVTRRVADHEIVLDMAEFFLVDKRVREVALASRSTFPFVRGQVGYVGFRREGIPYTRQRRIIGESHYNVFSAFRFGMAGILSSSTLPLRLLAYVGAVMLPLDVAAAVVVLVLGDRWGFDLRARVIFAFSAIHAGWLVMAAGFIGIYLARVYKDVIGLPLYVVDTHLSRIPNAQD